MSQKNRPSARRFFVVTQYLPGADGALEAAIPETCPLASPGAAPCDVRPHHKRRRKTGPGIPLTIAECHSHNRSFTLYPPAFGPYQRVPVVQIAPDGTVPQAETPDSHGLAAFEGTVFQAATDAERREAWARDSLDGAPDRWWSTQGRHIDLSQHLLGIASDIGTRLRERVASALSLDHLFLRDQARLETQGYHARASAVCRVLGRLKRNATTAMRLLYAGCLIGRWGVPRRWDPRRGVLELPPFRIPPLRAPA